MATSQTSTRKQRPIEKKQPLKIFFSRYSKFQYEPRNPPITEFNRLSKEYRWEQYIAEEKDARHEFNIALIKEFNSLYGSDEKEIKNWYKLCHVLRIDPVPNTLKECRAAVSRKHVNLIDLVGGSRENITIFKSEKELSEYTQKTKKIFPKENAVDGGVLRALRRHIWAPRESRPRRSRSRQGQHSQPGNSYHRQLRAFHSRVPIPSGDCGKEVSTQPMSSSPHAFEFNSPIAPIHRSCASALLPNGTTPPNLVPAAAQRGCTTTIPTTQHSGCHVTSHMRHYPSPSLSNFPPLKLLGNSHDRLYMSYHPLINRIGHIKDVLRPTRVPFTRGVGLSLLFQNSPSLPRASMCVRRVIFL